MDQLSKVIDKKSIGLYRDDGLAALKLTGSQADRARKAITKIFKDCDLKVTVEPLLPCTNFLDVTLDLASGNHWPFHKENNELQYINMKSNHPPTIIKHLPAAITHRISTLSCNPEEYMKALPAYKEALENSSHQLPNQPTQPSTRNKRQRHRNIIWLNPPYNQNVTINVAGRFLRLISIHFPKRHKYHKLFNRMNVKVSYSCMKNMGAIIAAHNAKV